MAQQPEHEQTARVRVPCEAVIPFFEELRERNLPWDLLTRGLDEPVTRLLDPSRTLSWESYRQILAAAGRVWCDEELATFGGAMARRRWGRGRSLFTSLTRPPIDFLKEALGPAGLGAPLVHQAMRADFTVTGPDRLQVDVLMREGCLPSRESFVAFQGALAAIPTVLGSPSAVVDREEIRGGARFLLRVPPGGRRRTLLREAMTAPLRRLATTRERDEAYALLQSCHQDLLAEIEERAEVEAGLRARETRLRSLVHAIPDQIFRVRRDGTIVDFMGTPDVPTAAVPERFLGRSLQEIMPPKLYGQALELGERALRSGEPVRLEYQLPLEGELYDFEARIAPCGQDEVVAIVRDVSERNRADDERERLTNQVEQVRKLSSLSLMAGGIAHDFNNLLVVIMGHLQLARAKLGDQHPALPSLDHADTAATRAGELTQQLLAYTGRGRLATERLDLTELLAEMGESFEKSASPRTLLRYALRRELPPVQADSAQLRRVILHLVTNAAEAIGDERGVITLRTSLIDADRSLLAETVTGRELPEGPYVALDVADTGCGMDEETLSRIFDPFFTTKLTGRGLGLAALLGIVRGHGGTLKVESAPGRGTLVRVLLPSAITTVIGKGDPDGQAMGSEGGPLLH